MDEINDVVQILNLGVEGMKFAIKAGGVFKKGIGAVSLKYMQNKMKVHYASLGENKTMPLKDLEKITGGDYRIMNIPTEDTKELIKFYDSLKKIKVPFAQLPDLNIGDGYTQIAYNPQDADKIRSFVEVYEFPEHKKAEECTFDEYMENATAEGMENLNKEAMKEAEKEEAKQESEKDAEHNKENDKKKEGENNPEENNPEENNPEEEKPEEEKQTKENQTPDIEKSDEEIIKEISNRERLKQRNQDDSYIPLTIDKTMIISETEGAFVTRVPHSYDPSTKSFLMFVVKKSDTTFVNEGQTLLTHLKKGEKTHLSCSKEGIDRSKEIDNQEMYNKHYGQYRQNFGDEYAKNKVHIHGKTYHNNPVQQINKIKL